MNPFKTYLPARIWSVVAFCCIFSLLTGCAGFVPASAPQVTCIPGGVGVQGKLVYTDDVYSELEGKAVKEAVDKIYISLSENINDPNKVAMAKREALKLLDNQTKRWSDVQYISLESQPRVRVIVSFITPGLVRAVVLNQWLYKLNSAQSMSLEKNTSDGLKQFDDRNEFAFLLLIQSEQQPAKMFLIQPQGIVLHNTSGLEFTTTHSDDFLNNSLSSTEKKQSGFFFYPLGRQNAPNCFPVLTSKMETSLMLKIDSVTVGEKTGGPYLWRIYFPLLSTLNSSLFAPDMNNPVQNGDDAYESPLSEPPGSTFDPNLDTIFWREMGRFIWWRLTMEHIQ